MRQSDIAMQCVSAHFKIFEKKDRLKTRNILLLILWNIVLQGVVGGDPPLQSTSMISTVDKELQKIQQKTTRYECQKARYLYRTKQTSTQFRRARTRTLIQLGGLVEKSGILEPLNITLGDDLQKEYEHQESAAVLTGALSELRCRFYGGDTSAQKMIWSERGKEVLGKRG